MKLPGMDRRQGQLIPVARYYRSRKSSFRQTERLFTIQKTGQEIHLEETFPDWETVVFGVRPCDARGVKLLDALFLDTNPVDSFYARRRENTTLIGLACKELGSTCFCTSVGGAPDDAHDMDIMLYEADGRLPGRGSNRERSFPYPGGEWKETTASPSIVELYVPSSRSQKRGNGQSISMIDILDENFRALSFLPGMCLCLPDLSVFRCPR